MAEFDPERRDTMSAAMYRHPFFRHLYLRRRFFEEDDSDSADPYHELFELSVFGSHLTNSESGTTWTSNKDKACAFIRRRAKKRAARDLPILRNKDEGKLKGNAGSGCDLPNYSWSQTLSKIEIETPITFPFLLTNHNLFVNFQRKHLTIGAKNPPLIINDPLYGEINVKESFWLIQGNILIVIMEKLNQPEWWSKLVLTDADISTPDDNPDSLEMLFRIRKEREERLMQDDDDEERVDMDEDYRSPGAIAMWKNRRMRSREQTVS